MNAQIRIPSYAKINLDLRLTGRYQNGYHRLLTLFHRLSLHDTLVLTRKREPGLSVSCPHPGVPEDEGNILFPAFAAMQKACPRLASLGVHVRIDKRIPVQAGLGGGSSNAAAFIDGLCRLCRCRVSLQTRMRIGARLGADVPFFLSGAVQARGTGRGDRISPERVSRKMWFVLIPFRSGLSTRDVYQASRVAPKGPSLTKIRRIVRIACSRMEEIALPEAAELFHNDLQDAAVRLKPAVGVTIRKARKLGAPFVQMTGSGPSVFAVFGSRNAAFRFRESWFPERERKTLVVCHTR